MIRLGVMILLALLTVLGPLASIGQGKQDHPCAASRQKPSHLLLADGITSAPHRALMRQYDIHWYKLNIEAARNSLSVQGDVIIGATAMINNFREFAFELHPNFDISQILIDGTLANFTRAEGEVIAALPSPKAKGQKLRVQIFYSGTAPSSASSAIGNGLNTAVAPPWGQQVTWSLSEPFAAYEWFPVKQLLADKADSVDVWVTTDVSNKVGSNGLLQRITPLPNGKHRFEWKSTYPIAYYLISIAVGQYQDYSFQVSIPGLSQPVLVQNFIYNHPQALPFYKEGVDRTGPFMQLFSELFGTYPFYKEKYGHSMAPMGGGMEHQTMTTQQDFEFGLTAHELAHQWWGDEVTNAGWSHIWLNEGFATYSEFLAVERLLPDVRNAWLQAVNQSALSLPTGKVFVEDSTNVNRIFNAALTYRKASLVMHMLRREVGEATFFNILKAYRQEYRYKVATTRDFQKVVERVTNKSFAYFFDQWIFGEGFPIFQVTWNQSGSQLYLRSAQTTSSRATPFFKTTVEFKVTTSLKDTLIIIEQDAPIETRNIKIAGTVLSVTIDPNQWLLDRSPTPLFDASLPAPVVEPFSVYPNPTVGELIIRGGVNLPTRLIFYDVLGRKVWSLVPQGGVIDVSGLKPGTYLLQAQVDGKTENTRFVKI